MTVLDRLSLAAFFCLIAGPVANLAQSVGNAGKADAKAGSSRSAAARVIDVEKARSAKQQEHRFQAHQLPLLPFRFLGRGMEKGLIAVDEHHLLDKAKYYATEHERGILPVWGHFGCRDEGKLRPDTAQSILWPPCPTTGNGLTVGAKYYRNDFIRPGGRFEIPVRLSSLLYQEYGLAVSQPIDAGRRIFFDAGAYYRVRTQDDFFGLGNNSRVGERTTYMLQTREVLFGPRFEVTPGLRLGTEFGYRGTNVFDGKNPFFPVITKRFARDQIPGLLDGAREWIAGAELVYDGRDVPGRPKRGGYHRFAASWHQSADSNDFGYWRYELEVQRYIPLWSDNRDLALRFLGISDQRRGGSTVPFFEQVILGGSSTMRGFREFRFYDLNGTLMSAEYRYNLNPFIDVLAFVEGGEVARHLSDLSWSGLHPGYGAGFRFLSAKSTPFKIVFGRSKEGTRVYFSLGATF